MALRFKVGDLAKVRKADRVPIGSLVEITGINVLDLFGVADYSILVFGFPCPGHSWLAMDPWLEPLQPPPEDNQADWEEIQKLTGWNPVKEVVRVKA